MVEGIMMMHRITIELLTTRSLMVLYHTEALLNIHPVFVELLNR